MLSEQLHLQVFHSRRPYNYFFEIHTITSFRDIWSLYIYNTILLLKYSISIDQKGNSSNINFDWFIVRMSSHHSLFQDQETFQWLINVTTDYDDTQSYFTCTLPLLLSSFYYYNANTIHPALWGTGEQQYFVNLSLIFVTDRYICDTRSPSASY